MADERSDRDVQERTRTAQTGKAVPDENAGDTRDRGSKRVYATTVRLNSSTNSVGLASGDADHNVSETLIRGMHAYWRRVMAD
jgi:hypothetical protein